MEWILCCFWKTFDSQLEALSGSCDETILGPGEYNAVEPGYYHQFEALEDGLAFEIYWAEFNHNDIEREYSGFDRENLPKGRE